MLLNPFFHLLQILLLGQELRHQVKDTVARFQSRKKLPVYGPFFPREPSANRSQRCDYTRHQVESPVEETKRATRNTPQHAAHEGVCCEGKSKSIGKNEGLVPIRRLPSST